MLERAFFVESDKLQKFFFKFPQCVNSSVSFELKHRKYEVMPSGNRMRLISETCCNAVVPGHVWFCKKFPFKPHLSGLRERPHASRVIECCDRKRVFARRQHAQAVLDRSFNKSFLPEKFP